MGNFNADLTDYPFASQRRAVLGAGGAVATSQPLAALAGMEMLLAGGNAVDAAIATAIALTVVEPTSNGIGGDAFALVWDGQRLHGLNGSGRSAGALPAELLAELSAMPALGWLSATVPGAVSAWQALWQRWGQLPFARLCEPAIRYAREGFPLSPVTAAAWQKAADRFLALAGPEHRPFQDLFFQGDRAPAVGEIWRSPDHATTLAEIAASDGESFYRGPLAAALGDFAAQTGGYLRSEDLAAHTAEWVEPISTRYRDLEIWEIPPNTQGLAALLALNILEGFPLDSEPRDSGQSLHWQIEAMKLAFADTYRYVADPRYLERDPGELLAKTYATHQRNRIGTRALPVMPAGELRGGTVYLATSDRQLMVSFIQSNYEGFGSGIAVPGTGIALHNRAAGFNCIAGHPNCFAPGKRPFHTIIPGFLTQDGRPLGPFGVMGGQMQPQGHLQFVTNLADRGLNPQAALDAPRWRYFPDGRVGVEPDIPPETVLDLLERGHDIHLISDFTQFGKGQGILRLANGALVAASEPRADGCALAI